MLLEISKSICVGCTQCIPWCPVAAISMTKEKKATIDQGKCVECWVCYKIFQCPVSAMQPAELVFPRDLMWNFAVPTKDWVTTRMAGRGTEEVKTNEVTGRVRWGEVGLALDFGRPGISTLFEDIEKVFMALAAVGVHFEKENPLNALFDEIKGTLKDGRLRTVRALQPIIECKFNIDQLEIVLRALEDATKKINTVVSVGLASRVRVDGTIPLFETLDRMGIQYKPNMKINLGLGRPLSPERVHEKVD